MSMRFISWKRLAVLATLSATFTGCGGGGGATETSSVSSEQESGTSTSTDVQAAASTATADAPASTMNVNIVQNGATTPAGETVAIFLDSLRRGNEQAANAVLTDLARQEISKSGFVLQPPGAPEGKFTIGRVTFEEGVSDVALVESTWIDPPAPGATQSVTNEIVCEVRQENGGWRISGIALEIEGLDTPLVLDFENSTALNATLAGAGVEPQPTQPGQLPPTGQLPPPGQLPPAGQQAALPPAQYPTDGTFPSQLPPQQPSGQTAGQLPPLNSQPAPGATQGATQIALPPLPTQPVRR